MKVFRRSVVALCAFLVAGTATQVLASTLRSSNAEIAGYKFRNVRITASEGSPDLPGQPIDVTVAYEIAWAGEEFPGQHSCTIVATGPDGAVLAEKTFDLYSMRPDFVPVHTEVDVPTFSEKPTAVHLDCAPARLDDSPGQWEFSNISIKREPSGAFGPATFRLSLDDRWTGSGHPSPQECTVTAKDTEGSLILTEQFGFNDASGGSSGITFDFEGLAESEAPASAEISCAPIS